MSRHPSISSSKRARYNPAEPIFFWVWLAILLWAPIPLGSNRPWAWALLEALVFSFTAVWLMVWAWRGDTLSVPFRRAWGILLLMVGWLLYQAMYFVPIPADWLAVLSPEALRSHQMADLIRTKSERLTLSIDPHAARVSWFKSLLYVLVFAMTLLVVSNRGRLRTLAYALVFAAVGMSVYGLVMNLLGVDGVWFGTDIPHSNQVSATYANRNHFAGYLEMMLAVGIGLLIAGLRDVRIETWRQFLRHTIEWILSPKMRLRLMLCVLVIALVSTHSRMGNTAFFASLLIAGVVGIALSRHATRSTVILLVSLIAIDVFIVGSWFGVEKLAERIESTSILKQADNSVESVEQRAEPSKYALVLLKDYPVFGTGPGSWYVAFPRYRGPDVAYFFDYAHNDYIQFAAESGWLGLGLLGVMVLWALSTALVAHYRRRDPLMRGMAFASMMGITAMLIHSFVDFNLQIPANAIFFMVLLALAWISLHLDRRETRSA